MTFNKHILLQYTWWCFNYWLCIQGRIQDFKLGGGALKKIAPSRGRHEILGYFVWKITILRQKILFFSIAEGGAKIFEVFRMKNHDFTPKKKITFFPILVGGARAGCAPPSLESAPGIVSKMPQPSMKPVMGHLITDKPLQILVINCLWFLNQHFT